MKRILRVVSLALAASLPLYPMSDYTELSTLSVATNLNAKANQTIGANVFNACMNDIVNPVPLDGDLWFEPFPSQDYRVQIWYVNNTTDRVDAGGIASPSGLSAEYLGITGEDMTGQSQPVANGTPDRHIRLRNLAGTPVRVQITSDSGGIWELPYNGANWVLATSYAKRAFYVERCNSLALYEMIKDAVVRYNAFFNESVTGKIRSKTKLNERLKFYQFELRTIVP